MDSEEDSFVRLCNEPESPGQTMVRPGEGTDGLDPDSPKSPEQSTVRPGEGTDGLDPDSPESPEQSTVRPGEGTDGLDPDSPESPEELRREIERIKELHSLLEQECVKLQTAKEAEEQRTQELRKDGDEERAHQMDIFAAQEKNISLRKEKQVLKNKLEELKRSSQGDFVMMQSGLPEKKMVFKGHVANKGMNKLMLTPQIRYPLPGGSALITFDKAEVAQRIIEMKEHMVALSCWEEVEDLDQCRIRVQAAPVEILLPSALEIRLTQSSRNILVSDLPSLNISEEVLLDKVELFFSKKKNGGSEVERREFLDDTNQVVLTFAQDGVAEPLIKRGHAQVPIMGQYYEVKILPCMKGDITDLQLQPSRCPRTVLLSGIPDVLAEESMKDTLEIHFQKASRGGGEVDSLAYVPEGRTGVAVLMEDTQG